ncbi:sulfurtransferase TusA family protein [Trichloromonas sp.]|uniref:sulfurtransferase TusA family protein n=1 Tax=Trichloromonas sp. TaxID=3069249 RepID=UPI003D816743
MEGKKIEQLEFDIRGQVCPSSLLTTLRVINRHQQALKTGALRLTVKTDARDATATIPQMVKNLGHAVSVVKQDGYYCIMIGKDL